MVSDSGSEVGSDDSLTEDKMLTSLIHEVIAEHKQEQADWNNFMRRYVWVTDGFDNVHCKVLFVFVLCVS